MANSFVRYTGNGTTTTYAIPFSYRSTDDLSATVAGVSVTAYTLDAAGTNLTFTTAPANGAAIEIRRTTSQNTKLVDYVSGSVLTENDLDTDSDQAFFMSQEAIDKAGDVISLDNVDFNWDVQNKRLKNVANPVDNTDAVNKQFISTNIPNITTVAGISSDVTTVAGISSDVTAVANDATDIGTVSANIASVNTVATNINDVIKVADDLNEAISEVETVANDLNEATSEIEVVANNIANVNAVGTDIANVNTVATDIANVNSVAGNSTNINAVAGNETNINAVNANSSNINAVNSNSANINTVAGNNANVSSVAGISGNVTTVAGISADVTAVAGDATDIGTVATDIADVTTVAGSIANVNSVATNIANVNSVAGNSANINAVAGNATNINSVNANSANINTVAGVNANVTTVAGSIANVNEVANNIGTVNNFGERYRVQAGEPSVDNDEGDLVYDTTANAVKVYNGTSFDTIQQGITDVAPTRHSIRPSLNLDFANSKALDPRITFTRGSNATYYDGYTTVKAEENLLEYSQEFDNSDWIKTYVTVTANDTTAPDGTTTADLIIPTTDNTNHWIGQNFTLPDNTYVISVFAKAGGYNWLKIFGVSSEASANFDLSTGSLGTNGGTKFVSASIQDVGNGWYRCSVVRSGAFSSTNVGFYATSTETNPPTGGNSEAGDGTSGIYLWGAQLEQRDSVTAYTPTTTAPITKYQPALQTAGNNVARFDHNPTTGESLGLLIEESRTNVATYSEDFSNANWGKTRCTIDSNKGIAPDGTQTADLIVSDGTSGTKIIYDASIITPTASSTWTVSVYAKTIGSVSTLQIEFGSGSNNGKANFDLSTGTVIFNTPSGTVSDATASITDVGNDWYRCSLTVTHSASWSGTTNIGFYDVSSSTTTFGSILIWGAQLEQGSFPTSYIKTTGSQVTRSADDVDMNNIDTSDWFKQGEGTLFLKGLKYNQDGGWFIGLNDGTLNNRIGINDNPSLTGSRYNIKANNVTSLDSYPNQSVSKGDYLNTIISYKRDDFSATANGLSNVTDTSGNVPIVDTLTIGRRWDLNINRLSSTIKKVSYYPKALTDNEITDLSEE